jgi:molybdopterin molybdotransferase
MKAITPAEAESIVTEHLKPLPATPVSFRNAYRRVLREAVLADRDFPPFNRVMMDGIAVRLDDWNGEAFANQGIQRAGQPAKRLKEGGYCLEIMTGAVVPEGADTVIPVEEILESDRHFSIREGYQPQKGQFVHRQGSDNRQGDTLLEIGTWLGAKEIAVLASCGYDEVSVSQIPRITIVSTGDELVDVPDTPDPFQIRKSNVFALEAACQSLPTPTKVNLDHLPDDRSAIAGRLPELMAESDLLLFSGGISKGKYDFLQELLLEAGAIRHFQWVRQRPGKPLWFGTAESGPVIFALPGNPNSTLTCFYRYVVDSINILAGIGKKVPEQAALSTDFEFPAPLAFFLPVQVSRSESGKLEVSPLPSQNSGDLSHLAHSDGFIELPADEKVFPVGFSAPFYSW